MKPDGFLKLFPPPKFLAQPAAGLDVSDQSVKFAVLAKEASDLKLDAYGEANIPTGLIEDGKIKNPGELTKLLVDFRHKFKLKNIFAALPEDQAYTFRLNLPLMKKSEVRGSIELQLEEYVPFPANQSLFDYTSLPFSGSKEEGISVGVSALPLTTAHDYLSVLEAAGFFVRGFELEAQAIARALIKIGDNSTCMIVDIGKIHTSFSVISHQVVVYSSLINVGGADLTRAIQRSLNVSLETAERYKIERGLSRSVRNQEVFAALIPVVSALKDEVQSRYQYWQDHLSGQGENKEFIDRVILCGGQSTLPGLEEYLSIYLGAKVTVGNSWVNIYDVTKTVPAIDFDESLRYTTALGLSLKSYYF